MKSLLENTRIVTKIVAMLAMLGTVTIGIALMNASTMRGIDKSYSELVTSELPATVQLVRMNRYATEMVAATYRAVTFAPGSAEGQGAPAALAKAQQDARAGLDKAVALDADLSRDASRIRDSIDEIAALGKRATDYARAGRRDEAVRLIDRAEAALAAFGRDMKALNDGRIGAATKQSDTLSSDTSSSVWWAIALSLIGTGLGIVTAFWLVRSGITSPLAAIAGQMQRLASGDRTFDVPAARRGDDFGPMGKAVLVFRDAAIEQAKAAEAKAKADAEQREVVETVGRHLDALAKGDLTAEVTAEFPESYQGLKTNFNAAIASLRELIAAVAESTAQIRTGAGEIATASEDLARRTESNAASLEETSAAIGAMDGRLKTTADSATRTVARADETMSTVTGGRNIADQAVQAMGRVSESAKGIDSVIEGLDKIAFQTRVLAMNAAVEAGRAGEAGRGFAVVADLVSALAMRAEEEAKRARDQLTVTQTDIVTAVDAVEKVDGALAAISTDVGAVHTLLAAMAEDNQAQASAITQINAAIGSMDQATQQNAAMVEETSAAARNLMNEVAALADKAGQFRTDLRPASAAAAPAKRAAPAPAKRPAPEKAYSSPVKPLPAAAVAALTRSNDDWNEF